MVRIEEAPLEVIEHHESHTIRQGEWEVGFHCQIQPKGDYTVVRPNVPETSFLDEYGMPLPELDWALASLYIRIPERLRKLAAKIPDKQWLALDAMRHVSGFDRFLAQEIKGPGVNFILAVWELGGAVDLSDSARRKLNKRMMTEERVVLLRDLAGCDDIDKGVLRVIMRSKPEDIRTDFILSLTGLMTDPTARKAVLSLTEMTQCLVGELLELPPWMQHPVLAQIIARDCVEGYWVEELMTPEIRNCDENLRAQMMRSLTTAKNWNDVEERLYRWLEKLDPDRRFPRPPIPGNSHLRPIRSVHELQKEGRQMCHCVGNDNYVNQALDGRSYFYRWIGEEIATVELFFHFPTKRWMLCNALGHCNKSLKPETLDAIKAVLAEQLAPPPIDTYVAGAYFCPAGDGRAKLRSGDELELRREPNHPFSDRVVAIHLAGGAKIGYLPKVESLELADRMDRGERFLAVVKNAEQNGYELTVSILPQLTGRESLAA
ncbi:MAG: hypothetical protein HQL43_12125 [Alphaproteobacteria bacterium]|nr:hypothetical protein [Alphaproteobacteria bacterium]